MLKKNLTGVSLVALLTSSPAMALPTLTFEDDFYIPFSISFDKLLPGVLASGYSESFSTPVSGFFPGFNNFDSRLAGLVGEPTRRFIIADLAGSGSITTSFTRPCSVSFPCPSASANQVVTLSVANTATGINMSDNENAPLFANPLPPSQFENPSFNFNGGQLGAATDPKLAPGVFAFDVQVDIATAGMRQVSYTNVAGLINGNISGNVETTVDIAKFSTNRDTLLGLSEEFHKLSILIEKSKLAYETADVVGKIKNGTEVPLNDLFELSRSYTNALYKHLEVSPGNTIENLNELLDSANGIADFISGISGDPVSAAKVIASNAVNITSLLSKYFEVWANDPPDSNFTRLDDISEKADAVASKFIELVDVPEFAEQREHLLYLAQTIKLAANNVAALTAYERFQGALLAGDYSLAQAQAMLMQKHLISADVDADAYAILLKALIAKNETGFDPLPPEIMGDILELFNILKQRLAESPEQVDDFFLPTFYSVPVNLDEFFLQAEAALLQELSAPLLAFGDLDSLIKTGINARLLTPSGSVYSGGSEPAPVPEPASLALFASGLLGLGFMRRRKDA